MFRFIGLYCLHKRGLAQRHLQVRKFDSNNVATSVMVLASVTVRFQEVFSYTPQTLAWGPPPGIL
jgi:hypothetical protein